jgi:hypothetical protein
MDNNTNQSDLETALGLILKFRETCPLSPEFADTMSDSHEISARNLINAKELLEKIGTGKSADIRSIVGFLQEMYVKCGDKICGGCYYKYDNLLNRLVDAGFIEKTYVNSKAHYKVKKKDGEQK